MQAAPSGFSYPAHHGTMGVDMEVNNNDSPETPDIVLVPGETPDDHDQTKLKRIWTEFLDAFNMRPPIDDEPQCVSL